MKGFEPQKAFLGLISTGDENAVLSWRGLAWESPRLWTFKDYIDRKWMKKYKVGTMRGTGAYLLLPLLLSLLLVVVVVSLLHRPFKNFRTSTRDGF